MHIRVTSLLPAGRDTVFAKLQEINTLRYICAPMARFEPLDDRHIWTAGARFRFNLSVMGIKFGVHTINVLAFDTDCISTKESNRSVPVWNHIITLEQQEDRQTKYTDMVEIRAGWRTIFIFLWANAFYRHRQRKWRKLLRY